MVSSKLSNTTNAKNSTQSQWQQINRHIDFLSPQNRYRCRHASCKNALLARAIGIKAGKRPRVMDATAGFGNDAQLIAALGCQVVMLERCAHLAALLRQALAKAENDTEMGETVARMRLIEADSITFLRNRQYTQRSSRCESVPPILPLACGVIPSKNRQNSMTIPPIFLGQNAPISRQTGRTDRLNFFTDQILPSSHLELRWVYEEKPDVIYLDPMFPPRKKTALVKKPLQMLQALLGGETTDAAELLQAAIDCAPKRIVVKRPLNAAVIDVSVTPSLTMKGRRCRFDIYLLSSPASGGEEKSTR